MSLLDLYSRQLEDGIQSTLRNPPPPVPASFGAWSFIRSGLKGPVAGSLDLAGSALDVASGGAQGGAGPDAAGNAYLGFDDAEFQRRMDAMGQPKFDNTLGNIVRKKANEFGPDPATSTTADQTIFGVMRFLPKAVGAIATMGPAGAVPLALEETDTAAQNLAAEGVAPATALKVGAVQGSVAGLGAVLPVAGSTLARTAGLVLAGGPGLYVAQEEASKRILQADGYNNQASLHDPTDPLGLALSTIVPGVIGGLHLAGAARQARLVAAVQQIESGGARFDANGNLLTSPKGAQGEMQVMPATSADPGFGVRPAADNSPDELARVGRDYIAAMEQRYGNTDKALAAYNAGPGAVDAAVAKGGADWLSHLPAETQAYVKKGGKILADHGADTAAADPAVVDAARVRVANSAVDAALPDMPNAHETMLRASDEVAAGRMPQLEAEPTQLDLDALEQRVRRAKQEFLSTPSQENADYAGSLDHYVSSYLDQHPEWANVDAHGMAGGNLRSLDTILRNGLDADRPFYSVEVGSRGKMQNADRVNDTAAFVLLGRPDGTPITKGGIDSVLVNGAHASAIPELAAAHPNVRFIDARSGEVVRPPAPRVAQSRSQGTNAIPAPEAASIKPSPLPKRDPGVVDKSAVSALAESKPDLRVRLPGSEETLSIAEALKRATDAAAAEMGDSKLVQAALNCALGG